MCAIGPALINLKEEVVPLEIFIDKRPIKFVLSEVERLIFLESEEPINENSEIVYFVLKFKSFECSIKLINSFNPPWSKSDKNCRLTISTLQKDNPIVWIKDWIRWHCRLYGVGRVILYDNGSRNQQDLIEKLRELQTEVEIVFVHWDFPYGLHPNRYTQRGSLNHCRMHFRPQGDEKSRVRRYCINLDIDEYLVCLNQDGLVNYLDSMFCSPFIYSVMLKEIRVPNISPQTSDLKPVPRFFDYKYRSKKSDLVDEPSNYYRSIEHAKYVFRFGSPIYNEIHDVSPITHYLKLTERIQFHFYRIPIKIKRKVWKLKRLFRDSGNTRQKPLYNSAVASTHELYFFHFFGLTDNWNQRIVREVEEFNAEFHVEESLIQELAQRVSIYDT